MHLHLSAQDHTRFYYAGEDLLKKTEKLLYIEVSVDKKRVYEGEPVVATYRLFVAVELQGKLSKAPSFSGFSSYEIEGARTDSYEVQTINSIRYKVYLIKKLQLYPLQAGRQTLEPIELEATVQYKLYGGGSAIMEQPYNGTTADTLLQFTARSAPVDVLVEELPDTNNDGFNGAVGKFEVSSALQKGRVPAGDADTMFITIQGEGNWHQVLLPSMVWPTGVEVFEPYVSETTDAFSIPLKGRRTYAIPLVAERPGIFHLPSLVFKYFDPSQKKYFETSTTALKWEVVEKKAQDDRRPHGRHNIDLPGKFRKWGTIFFPSMALLLIAWLFLKKKNEK